MKSIVFLGTRTIVTGFFLTEKLVRTSVSKKGKCLVLMADKEDGMSEKAWLDVSIFRCPRCERYYADASWYAVELESDIECGSCHEIFKAKKQLTDRLVLEFKLDKEGKVLETVITEHIPVVR